MFQFSIPESNFDTKVTETSSTCLNASKLTCNLNNIIHFKRYINNHEVLRIAAWIRFFLCNLRRIKEQIMFKEPILKLDEFFYCLSLKRGTENEERGAGNKEFTTKFCIVNNLKVMNSLMTIVFHDSSHLAMLAPVIF